MKKAKVNTAFFAMDAEPSPIYRGMSSSIERLENNYLNVCNNVIIDEDFELAYQGRPAPALTGWSYLEQEDASEEVENGHQQDV